MDGEGKSGISGRAFVERSRSVLDVLSSSKVRDIFIAVKQPEGKNLSQEKEE